MQETAQQFQAAEEARVVASKEVEESKHEMEVQMEQAVETQQEAEVAAEVAEKEEQIVQNKERRVEIAAAENIEERSTPCEELTAMSTTDESGLRES